MHQPKYMEKLYAFIFLCLGSGFIVMGLLSDAGIVKPTAQSAVQDPNIMGFVFLLMGIAFCAAQTIFRVIAAKKNKLHNELTANGIRVHGSVEKVILLRFTQYGKKSPYRICYTYTLQGDIFHHKSCLLWDKPDYEVGDPILVYANNSGKSTIQFE